MQTLVEIGPSNASQGQYRRKDAAEQMKNLTYICIYIYTYMLEILLCMIFSMHIDKMQMVIEQIMVVLIPKRHEPRFSNQYVVIYIYYNVLI